MMRSAAVNVRRPGASRAPATSTRTWRQTAGVKADAKGCIHAASTAGTLVGMAQASAWVVGAGRGDRARRDVALSEKKSEPLWVWKAWDRASGQLVDWECGGRD